MVPWDHVIAQMERNSSATNLADFPKSFISGVNDMIKRNSADTAVSFLNLPLPPTSSHQNEDYIEGLRTFTADLPPLVLVHGLSSVISTAL